jgi:membrane-bound metal-dependent hydrolase YbcI (DUF457 family)
LPFTPFHMGPGILVKALLQSSFSLMVFAWSQIVMDIQPLLVLISGQGHLHGFSHTYLGALLFAIFSASTGKYVAEFGLRLVGISKQSQPISILWSVALLSAILGCFSHVMLDSLMHSDLQPFYPFDKNNPFLGWVSVHVLHKFCLYSGLIGAAIFYLVQWLNDKPNKQR